MKALLIIVAIGSILKLCFCVEKAWKYLKGSQLGTYAGVYGTTLSTINFPGARRGAAVYRYSSTRYYLFGGYGYTDDETGPGLLNDFWTIQTDVGEMIEWDFSRRTYPGGDNRNINQYGRYYSSGRRGGLSGSDDIFPGGRYGCALVGGMNFDGDSSTWILGGYGRGSSTEGFLSDVFVLDSQLYGEEDLGIISGTDDDGYYPTSYSGYSSSYDMSGRKDFVAWKKSSSTVHVFGGYGIKPYPGTGEVGYLNDVFGWYHYDSGRREGSPIRGAYLAGTKNKDSSTSNPVPTGFSNSNYPSGRAGCSYWVASPYGYLYGGKDSVGTYLTEVWAYDMNNEAFKKLQSGNYDGQYVDGFGDTLSATNLPNYPPLAHHATFWGFGTEYYIFGGQYDGGVGSELWSLTITSNTNVMFKFHKYASKDSLDAPPNYDVTLDGQGFPGSHWQGSGFGFTGDGEMHIFGGMTTKPTTGEDYSNNQFTLGDLAHKCNGYPPEDSRACSDHTCLLNGTCYCDGVAWGVDCSYVGPSCYGYFLGAACSGHGSCTDTDNCTCDVGYTVPDHYPEKNCSVAVCDNILGTDGSVCNGHGSCTIADSCVCDFGYGPPGVCDTIMCDGKLTTSPDVCGGQNGTCDDINICSCSSDYYLPYCEDWGCFGVSHTLPSSTCHNHGDCVSAGVCSCDAGYGVTSGDEDCEFPKCGAYYSDDVPLVCSGGGECLGPDNCVCWDGYGPPGVCDTIMCYGFDFNEDGVCSNHGGCMGPNQCLCNSSYAGVDCSEWGCYGIEWNDTSVCSDHGNCTDINVCECDAGYGVTSGDEDCEFPLCGAYYADNVALVCNGGGDCVNPNECICRAGRGPPGVCDTIMCFGLDFNEDGVCSNHGGCIGPNQCLCNASYDGVDCSEWDCFGIEWNDTSTCSNHGNCTAFDFCECDAVGYGVTFGNNDCEFPLCGAYYADNVALVCSGGGDCVNPNECICKSGYGPPGVCDQIMCYGYYYNEDGVCSNHGGCIGPNKCLCNASYDGVDCSEWVCYGIEWNDTSTCSNHGNCTAFDFCECETGYGVTFGDADCEFPQCGTYFEDNLAQVCGGGGNCVNPNECICRAGYGPPGVCDTIMCFGIDYNEDGVCSNHGGCIGPNQCLCNESYNGVDCSEWDCFGIEWNDTSTCSNHGNCTNFNDCECDIGYGVTFGDQDCEFPQCGTYFADNVAQVCGGGGDCVDPGTCDCRAGNGPPGVCDRIMCFGIYFNEEGVCSNHGGCVGPNQCLCNASYDGVDCSEWDCFGIEWNDTSTCSNHGNCTAFDFCECDVGYGVTFGDADCEFPKCGAYFEDNLAQVCGGGGNCVNPEECICRAGNGPPGVCDQIMCYGYYYNEDGVCSNHGGCIGPNKCLCNASYDGVDCSEWECYNIDLNDTDVCSTYGNCTAHDVCECDYGWGVPDDGRTIKNCSVAICNSAYDGEEGSCNNHGHCVSPDECICFYGWGVPGVCDTFLCFGELSGTSDACNDKNGNCIDVDRCNCTEGYLGASCDYFKCYDVMYNHSLLTCTNHGDCESPDNCTCYDGYYGDECQNWDCGTRNKSDDLVCKSHGSCDLPEFCDCDPGYFGTNCHLWNCSGYSSLDFSACNSHGWCTESETCDCDEPYYGENCRIRMDTLMFTDEEEHELVMDYSMPRSFVEGSYPYKFFCFGLEGTYGEVLARNQENYDLVVDESETFCYFIVDYHDSAKIKSLRIELSHSHVCEGGDVLQFLPLTDVSTIVSLEISNNDTAGVDFGSDLEDEYDTTTYVPGDDFGWLFSVLGVFFFLVLVVTCCLCIVAYIICCFCCTLIVCLMSGTCGSLGIARVKLQEKENELNKMVFGDGKDYRNKRGTASVKFNIELFQIKDTEFELKKMIGQGGSNSTIYLAKWRSQDVAVKIFHTASLFEPTEGESNLDFEEFEREINILNSISHPNIINIYGCCIRPPRVCLVLEFAHNGDVRQYYKKCCGEDSEFKFFDFPGKLKFCLQVSAAIEYLHSRKIIHRDLKSDNILLLKDLTPKVIDFGLSKVNQEATAFMTRKVGTSQYMAPEVIRGDYDESCDVYSFSIICFEIFLENFTPYAERMKMMKTICPIEYVVEKDPNFRPIIKEEFQKERPRLAHLITQMWLHDQEDRPTISQVKDFFEKYLDEILRIGKCIDLSNDNNDDDDDVENAVNNDVELEEYSESNNSHHIEKKRRSEPEMSSSLRDLMSEVKEEEQEEVTRNSMPPRTERPRHPRRRTSTLQKPKKSPPPPPPRRNKPPPPPPSRNHSQEGKKRSLVKQVIRMDE